MSERRDIGAKWSLVDQYLKYNRYQEAAELSDVILAIDDRHAGAWFAKGLYLFRLKKFSEALEFFQ